MYNDIRADIMLLKFIINSTSSLATIISWEGIPYKDTSADTNKMNKWPFSITTINNLLKVTGTVEASSGFCDSITVELDEAKLSSCFCGWVYGAFGCETCTLALFFFFFGAYISWLLITIHKNQGLQPCDKWSNDMPNKVHFLIDWYRKWDIWNQHLLNLYLEIVFTN